MITVTSAEKNRIEGQMKTALPFLNEQLEFQISIEDGNKGRSRLTFKQGEVVYQLPIFYITPSTDDSAWEMMTDQIEEETDSQGIFIIKFNSEQHLIHNAVTYAITNHELYQKNVLSEMCRLCSYVDLESYKFQLFDTSVVTAFFEKLSKKQEEVDQGEIEQNDVVKEAEAVMDASHEETKEIQEEVVETTHEEVKEIQPEPVVAKKRESVEPVKVKTAKAPVKEEAPTPTVTTSKTLDDSEIDLDIKALINDCFGIF